MRSELRSRGVTHAALFGSRARGEARADSDIDIMVEIAPEAAIDLFHMSELPITSKSFFRAL